MLPKPDTTRPSIDPTALQIMLVALTGLNY